MKAYWITPGPGGTKVELRETATPEPKAGEILVRVRAAALNRGELLGGKAGASAKPGGGDCSGDVVKVGDGVAGISTGDRVMGRCGGGFAEYALIDAREAMPVPAQLSFEQAAAMPLVFLVVYDMLVAQGCLTAGQWLLVTGVSSGVGVAALQTAKVLGARVIGTSGSGEKLARLQGLGLDLGIRTRTGDFYHAVMKATENQGVNLVVNTVGGSVFPECIRVLAFEGRLATVGHLDRVLTSTLDLEALHGKRLTLFGVSNRLRSAAQRAETVRGFVRDLLPYVEDGRLRPLVDKVYGFEDLPAAIKFMETDAQVGKIVVRALTT
ncbi:MAG TPA: zinc-binding dehydrogenase [Acidiferrobacterales bacterium]|nr:zinc-binding dehydrogenase [Acidiferrobacterales bacterium]